MIRIFIVGIVLGAAGAAALTWYLPAVDLHRERSLIRVQPNGGNIELYNIDLPRDRILVGLPNPDSSIPAGLKWPGDTYLGDMQAELFKVRDNKGSVIGVASRLASATDAAGPFIEWVLHLPARGTMYVQMEMTPMEDGVRNGVLRAGTRGFGELTGSFLERFIADVDGDADVQGRIQLEALLVGPLEEEE